LEQAARLRWLPEAEQNSTYFKFVRESVLRTNSKTRAELHEIEIRTGILKPNEAREHEDRDSYPDGDKFWMTRNNAEIGLPLPGQTGGQAGEQTGVPQDVPA
jgi:phage portal protein BeeE